MSSSDSRRGVRKRTHDRAFSGHSTAVNSLPSSCNGQKPPSSVHFKSKSMSTSLKRFVIFMRNYIRLRIQKELTDIMSDPPPNCRYDFLVVTLLSVHFREEIISMNGYQLY